MHCNADGTRECRTLNERRIENCQISTIEILPERLQVVHRQAVGALFEAESIDVAFHIRIRRKDMIQSRFHFIVVLLHE